MELNGSDVWIVVRFSTATEEDSEFQPGQRDRVRFGPRPLVDQFEHAPPSDPVAHSRASAQALRRPGLLHRFSVVSCVGTAVCADRRPSVRGCGPRRGCAGVASARVVADLIRSILANDQPAITAHDYATHIRSEALPDRVRSLLKDVSAATDRRKSNYQAWQSERQEYERNREQAREQHIGRSRDRGSDYGVEL